MPDPFMTRLSMDSDYRKKLRDLETSNPRWGAKRLAAELHARLSDYDIQKLALAYLAEIADGIKRERAQKIEEEATAPRETEARQAPEDKTHESYPWNKAGRKACRKCGCLACLQALGENERFESDLREKHNPWPKVMELIKSYEAEIRLEVTEDLLGSEFALGDGKRVTWGDATVEDHQQRIDLLAKNAAANISTATKHQAALVMLTDRNVPTLREYANRELITNGTR